MCDVRWCHCSHLKARAGPAVQRTATIPSSTTSAGTCPLVQRLPVQRGPCCAEDGDYPVEYDVRWYSDYQFNEANEESLAGFPLEYFPEVFASGNTGGVFREPVPPTDTEPGQLLLTPLADLPSVAEGLAAESEAPFLQATDAFLVNARAVRAPPVVPNAAPHSASVLLDHHWL